MADKYSELWNSLPDDERKRLSPFLTGYHVQILRQTRVVIVRNHKRLLAELDGQIKNLEQSLNSD